MQILIQGIITSFEDKDTGFADMRKQAVHLNLMNLMRIKELSISAHYLRLCRFLSSHRKRNSIMGSVFLKIRTTKSNHLKQVAGTITQIVGIGFAGQELKNAFSC